MSNTKRYKYHLRPGFKTKELIIEIFSGVENEHFQNDLSNALLEIQPILLKKEDAWMNDEVLYHFNSTIGKFIISSSSWGFVFIEAKKNQNRIITIEQLLKKNSKFEKIEVDFDEYS